MGLSLRKDLKNLDPRQKVSATKRNLGVCGSLSHIKTVFERINFCSLKPNSIHTTTTKMTLYTITTRLATKLKLCRKTGRHHICRSLSSSSRHQVNGFATRSVVDDHQDDSSLPDDDGEWIQGQVLDLAADLRTFRPGDKLDIPYELTVSESMQDFWQSAFHMQDRIHTSTPFCRKMGLQDRVLPFSLALFLTSSMTHADAAKIQVGFGKVSYLWPTFAGDTFTKSFTVDSIRNTSDGNHSIIQLTCDLINQRGRLCMRADKRMMFELTVPESNLETMRTSRQDTEDPAPNLNLLRDHLLSRSDVLSELNSHSLADLRPGQLILHSLNRSLTFTQSQQLASLARLTHEKHFDCRKYDQTELLIPGGLVLGITMSASARDFHELLHEEILNVNYVNSLHPGNMVGAVSYIQSVEDVVGDLQVVTVRTLGIKNMDVKKDLDRVDLPLDLFHMDASFKAKDIQRLCKTKCPSLHNKIVVQIDRRILRQASRQEVFLL